MRSTLDKVMVATFKLVYARALHQHVEKEERRVVDEEEVAAVADGQGNDNPKPGFHCLCQSSETSDGIRPSPGRTPKPQVSGRSKCRSFVCVRGMMATLGHNLSLTLRGPYTMQIYLIEQTAVNMRKEFVAKVHGDEVGHNGQKFYRLITLKRAGVIPTREQITDLRLELSNLVYKLDVRVRARSKLKGLSLDEPPRDDDDAKFLGNSGGRDGLLGLCGLSLSRVRQQMKERPLDHRKSFFDADVEYDYAVTECWPNAHGTVGIIDGGGGVDHRQPTYDHRNQSGLNAFERLLVACRMQHQQDVTIDADSGRQQTGGGSNQTYEQFAKQLEWTKLERENRYRKTKVVKRLFNVSLDDEDSPNEEKEIFNSENEMIVANKRKTDDEAKTFNGKAAQNVEVEGDAIRKKKTETKPGDRANNQRNQDEGFQDSRDVAKKGSRKISDEELNRNEVAMAAVESVAPGSPPSYIGPAARIFDKERRATFETNIRLLYTVPQVLDAFKSVVFPSQDDIDHILH